MVVVVAVLADGYFVVSRCVCSPQIHAVGLAVGLLVQTAAVSIPLVVNRLFHDSELRVRLRAVGIGLFACILSLPLMETALLFGDSIGQVKGFPSSGYTCDYSRLFPDGMPPNKLLHPTCEDARA
jgi:hypothetical protein